MVLTAVEWLTLIAVLGLLLAITKTLIGRDAKIREERIQKNENRVDELERNHVAKFDEVKDCIIETKTSLLSAVSALQVDMAKNYVTKSECRYVQEQVGK